MRDFLMHHGIKGQKWGVRRFQNKDGSLTDEGRERYRYEMAGTRFKRNIAEKFTGQRKDRSYYKRKYTDKIGPSDIVVNKNTGVYHVTPDKDFDLASNPQRLYVYTDIDKPNYEGIFSAYQRIKNKPMYKVELELARDLNVAGKDTQKKYFDNLYEEYGHDVFIKELRPLCEKFNSPIPDSKDDAYVSFMEFGPYIENGNLFKEYSNRLKKNEYDAITDINDIEYEGIGSIKPLILLDVLSSVSNVKVSDLKDSDIEDAIKLFGSA